MSQSLETPPGELPPFIAYRLNGGPIPLERGGPVRMVVPWAHGFKSVKWLQRIVLTNNHQANDSYADRNNDPESYLKTAAYFDSVADEPVPSGRQGVLRCGVQRTRKRIVARAHSRAVRGVRLSAAEFMQ